MVEPFRVCFVPGVTPGTWLRTWAERSPAVPLVHRQVDVAEQTAVLRSGAADMCFVRDVAAGDGLHVIPLYTEVPVVVAAKDHPVAAYAEIDVAELADEHLLQDPDDVPAWRDVAHELRAGTRAPVPVMTVPQALEVVAAGAGIVVVPMSVARLYHRKDVVHRPVLGVPGSRVGLAWPSDADDPRIETFIGIVRGRTPRSSRAGGAAPPADGRPTATVRRKGRPPAGGAAGGRRGAPRRRDR